MPCSWRSCFVKWNFSTVIAFRRVLAVFKTWVKSLRGLIFQENFTFIIFSTWFFFLYININSFISVFLMMTAYVVSFMNRVSLKLVTGISGFHRVFYFSNQIRRLGSIRGIYWHCWKSWYRPTCEGKQFFELAKVVFWKNSGKLFLCWVKFSAVEFFSGVTSFLGLRENQ